MFSDGMPGSQISLRAGTLVRVVELRARNLFRSLDTNPLIPLVLESLFIFSPLSIILSPIFTLDSLKYIT